jgi:Mrp family chromosome partitioning ATPase
MSLPSTRIDGGTAGATSSQRHLISRAPLPTGQLGLRPELVEACRPASLQLGGPTLRSLGVSSTLRGEGRSSVARAMACIQAEDYHRSVVLVDLDLEGPGLATALGASPFPGLAELAAGSSSLEDVLQPVAPGVALIVTGALTAPVTRTMADILGSDVLQALTDRFDVVIADLPPLLACSFGRAAVGAFPDLLLVIRAGVTPLGRIRLATAHLPVQPTVLLNGTHSHLPRWLQRLAAV